MKAGGTGGGGGGDAEKRVFEGGGGSGGMRGFGGQEIGKVKMEGTVDERRGGGVEKGEGF